VAKLLISYVYMYKVYMKQRTVYCHGIARYPYWYIWGHAEI